MEITLRPTTKQHLAYQSLKDEVIKYPVFGGGAGGGKSWLGCEWLITNCIQFPGTKWFIGREELKRLMSSTYITFQKVCKHHKIPQGYYSLNGQYNYIEFSNGSRIDLLDVKFQPSDPLYERFGSLEYTGGWLEEAGEINFLAFDVLKTRVGRHMNDHYEIKSKILITCNPKKNWLYQKVYKPWKTNTLPKEYAFIQSLYGDNEYSAKDYEENLSQISDKATLERLKYGNWEYDDDPTTLINYDAITDLFTNTIVEKPINYIVSDIARYGGDKTVITVWRGLKCKRIETFIKQGTVQTAEKIKQLAVEENVPYSQILIDEDGVGGGVVDQLLGVKGFVANSTPFEVERLIQDYSQLKPDNYQNLKAQCAYKLADIINTHQMAVVTEDEKVKELLTEELEQIKSKDLDDDGKRKIVSKDEIKERIGRSPDYSDCLLMRMYFEFVPVFNGQVKGSY
jgi:hypothetical protein